MGWFKKAFGKAKGVELAAAEVAGGVVGSLIDAAGTFGEKHTGKREFKLQMEARRVEMERVVTEALAKREGAFREFVLAYEGAAADQHPVIQVVRGLVRPVVTLYLLAALSFLGWAWLGEMSLERGEQLIYMFRMMFFLNLIAMVFWFGDRLIQRTGVVEMLKGWLGKA